MIWRPDIAYSEARVAYLPGWTRRFWQGSHDHRGVPETPGRVVTLVAAASERCIGMAYRVEAQIVAEVFDNLDYREKNGYRRHEVALELTRDASSTPATSFPGVVYIAAEDNHAFLGPAPTQELADQIFSSVGPSGTNRDYLYQLAEALRQLDAHDPHVFELEALVRQRESDGHQLQR